MMTSNPDVRRCVRLALEEDIGTGDITSDSVVPCDARAIADVKAKEQGVLAGIPVAIAVLDEVDPSISVSVQARDGSAVRPGDVVLRAAGPARSLLVAERPLLNFVMHLSGIATVTRRFVDALAGTRTRVLDTRKTTPGMRVLEKYAVRAGGGRNHRMGLFGGVLIKNNHLAVCGNLRNAVEDARAATPFLARIEVEVRSVEQAAEAIASGADVLLLDHMTRGEMAEVVALARGRVETEASGDITFDSLADVAAAGVDFVSAGALTHSARWLDFGMYLVRDDSRP